WGVNTIVPTWKRGMLGFFTAKGTLTGPNWRGWTCTVWRAPYWSLVVAFGALPLMSLRRGVTMVSWARRGKCRSCGYDIRATPHKCPECGHVVATVPAKVVA